MVIIFLVIYLLSAFGHYKLIQLTHYHPKGRYFGIDAFKSDMIATFIPLVNTVLCLDLSISWKKRKRSSNNFTNFFKPKNHDNNR